MNVDGSLAPFNHWAVATRNCFHADCYVDERRRRMLLLFAQPPTFANVPKHLALMAQEFLVKGNVHREQRLRTPPLCFAIPSIRGLKRFETFMAD
jgi:hypothetical protein